MKSINSGIVFVGLLLMAIGCSQEESRLRVVDDFPEPVELEGSEILEEVKGLLYATVTGDYVICVTPVDPFFHIYDRNRNHITSFGKKGRGPGEFVVPPIINDMYRGKGESITILVENQLTQELYHIDLAASVKNGELILDKNFKIPKKLWGLRNIFYLKDNKFVGTYDDRDQKRLDEKRGGFYFWPESDSIATFDLFNLTIEPYEMIHETNLNARATWISPDRFRLASLMIHYPRIDLFEIGSEKPKSFLLDSNPPGEVFDLDDFKEEEVVSLYEYMYVTEKYIYILTENDKKEQPKKDQKLMVMDWKGNPQAQYAIPKKYDLSTFVVDENDTKVYGSSYNNDSIYTFNL